MHVYICACACVDESPTPDDPKPPEHHIGRSKAENEFRQGYNTAKPQVYDNIGAFIIRKGLSA